MRAAAAALCLALIACGSGEEINEAAADPTRAGADCADHLAVQVDRASFAAAGIGAAREEIDRWGERSARAFKAAAAGLCGEGWLNEAGLAAFEQLSVQYAGGADSASVWQDEDRPGVVILEYAFSPGAPPPAEADVRDAIRCWAQWDETLCSPRLP